MNVNRPFWAGAAGNAVIIEADAFKESDVIYRALSSRGHGHVDMLQTAELVRYKTDSLSVCPSSSPIPYKQKYPIFFGTTCTEIILEKIIVQY
jgi:hypothetical protein